MARTNPVDDAILNLTSEHIDIMTVMQIHGKINQLYGTVEHAKYHTLGRAIHLDE